MIDERHSSIKKAPEAGGRQNLRQRKHLSKRRAAAQIARQA